MKTKFKIIEKAWRVNADRFEEPWHHGEEIYYGTKGGVKESAVVDNYCGKLTSGKDISFLTIPIIRAKEHDKILFNGVAVINRYEIKDKIRLVEITRLPCDKTYYVQDARSYVGNAVLWWGLDGRGYVTDLSKAHKYTWREIQEFNPRNTDIIWESGHVESAIRQYVDIQGLDRNASI